MSTYHKTWLFTGSSLPLPPASPALPHRNRWRFMLGTIRTIQHRAGQALPTCVQPNHNLMNTLGAVCSKLLPVGDRAAGNLQPPPAPPHHHPLPLPPHLTSFCSSFLAHPPKPILAPVLRPQLWLLIKSRFISRCCQHSNTAQRGCARSGGRISYMWGDVDWQLKCLCIAKELVLFDRNIRAVFVV